MNINNATPNYATSSHSQEFSLKQTSNKRAGENTAPRVSIVPEADVSPLLTLPDELLLNITKYLPLRDISRLASTNTKFSTTLNTEEKLRILSDRYYGSASEAYRKSIESREIPAVPNHEIDNPLRRLIYHRVTSNKYLNSLGSNTQQLCVATLKGHRGWVFSVTALPDGRLASSSVDKTVRVWDLSKPDGQQCVATLVGHTSGVNSVTELPDGRLVSCSFDNTVKVWDLNNTVKERSLSPALSLKKEKLLLNNVKNTRGT